MFKTLTLIATLFALATAAPNTSGYYNVTAKYFAGAYEFHWTVQFLNATDFKLCVQSTAGTIVSGMGCTENYTSNDSSDFIWDKANKSSCETQVETGHTDMVIEALAMSGDDLSLTFSSHAPFFPKTLTLTHADDATVTECEAPPAQLAQLLSDAVTSVRRMLQ